MTRIRLFVRPNSKHTLLMRCSADAATQYQLNGFGLTYAPPMRHCVTNKPEIITREKSSQYTIYRLGSTCLLPQLWLNISYSDQQTRLPVMLYVC